ncbi:hypothetical protein EGQ24_06725 [bacterium]|nr:hypothetical protein [bacterium]
MLMAFWQVQRLTREINALERQAMETRNRLSNYQKYAGMLGGSSTITMANVAGMSAELLPRATMFAQFSNQASSMSAMQNLQSMKMGGMVPWTGNALAQYQMEMSAFSKFKEESMKALKEQEIQVLNEKEKEIQLEMNDIEQRLSMKRAELQSVKQLASEEARESAPKFGLG